MGKTSISLDLATRMRCEIISADSVQASIELTKWGKGWGRGGRVIGY